MALIDQYLYGRCHNIASGLDKVISSGFRPTHSPDRVIPVLQVGHLHVKSISPAAHKAGFPARPRVLPSKPETQPNEGTYPRPLHHPQLQRSARRLGRGPNDNIRPAPQSAVLRAGS